MKWAALIGGIGAFVALTILGAPTLYNYLYFGEARAVRRLAEEIDGVVVRDVDGNHDIWLEDIWLDIEYRGEPLYFYSVTADSFEETDSLFVGQVGPWDFTVRWYDADVSPDEAECWAYGGCLDFGPAGDVGRRIDPPIRSIPEFLRRLPEVRAVVEGLPQTAPGVKVGTDEYRSTTIATGKLNRRPVWIWAYREPAEAR